MPLYTAIGQEGTISTATKAKLAEEITRRTWSVSRAIIEPNYLTSTALYSAMEGFFR
jgi:phenylpyruvate tautomerase PptA (4-oxalocrotonate tautomerase family)